MTKTACILLKIELFYLYPHPAIYYGSSIYISASPTTTPLCPMDRGWNATLAGTTATGYCYSRTVNGQQIKQ